MKKTAGFLIALTLIGASMAVPASADEAPQMVHIFDSISSTFVPTEIGYSDGTLWGLNSKYGINAQGALDITQGSKDVVVGVIDTGITSHSDLNANVVPGYDFVSGRQYDKNGRFTGVDLSITGDGDGQDPDASDPGDFNSTRNSTWHGTHVAGIIGALANGTGVIGVTPNVSLMPLRALGSAEGIAPDIIDAITWGSGGKVSGITAVPKKRADILNLSLGGSGSCPSSFQTAIDGAVSRGTVVVVAAGNGGADLANTFPANCNNVVTVMASSEKGARTSWSNFVVTPPATNSVYVTAPGLNIYSTYNEGKTSPGKETYELQSGTSMATPFVSGIIALIRGVQPTASVEDIRNLLKDPANTTDGIIGTKIINAGKLIQAASGITPTPVNPETLPTVASEITNSPAPIIETPHIVAPVPLTFAAKKKFSAKNFATQSGITIPKKSTVSLKVLAGKKACAIKSGKLATLKAGSCLVSVKVVTTVKVGKKYKKKSTTTKVNMLVA